MRKFKVMLIALLCAVTTIVTLGAVNSFTAKADEGTSTYEYVETSVVSVSVNTANAGIMKYPRLELTGVDYKNSSGTYNKTGDYSALSGLNTFTKIKIGGEAVGTDFDGSAMDPYLNMYDNSVDRFAFKYENFPSATEITIEAGCEFPSYTLWSGTGNVVYRTTEDVTFVKNNGVWVKKINYTYADTYAASVSANAKLVTYPRIELIYTDYKKSGGSFNNEKKYDTLYGLNTFTKIKIDGIAVNAIYDGTITDPHLNMYDNSVDRFAFKYEDFPKANEVIIEEGCEFPSYALWSGNGTLVYRMAETATFKKVDGVWVKQLSSSYRDTNVTSIKVVSGWEENTFLWFGLTDNDYKGRGNYNNAKNNIGDYTNINGLNTFSKIKVDGTAVGGAWDGTRDPYINLYSEGSFAFKCDTFKTATEITIEAGCEFPSYIRWSIGANMVYRTTEDVTFGKVGGGWYKVYTATFVDEDGNELGKSTFTTADAALTYPTYEADPAYDYAWTGNEIKAENITVTLTKTIKTFDVKIGDAEAVKYNYGTKIIKPATDPEKAADAEYTYTFAGWYNGETEWNFETDTVTENVTLTAKFDKTAITYTLTFKSVDGTETTVSYTTLTRAEKLAELKAMLHTDDAQYSYTNTLPEELPLENGRTYEEKRTVKKYTVKIGDGDSAQVEYGAKLTKPATDPVKEEDDEYSYTFKGWYNGETEWNFETDTVTGNVTLTAKFDSVKKQTESSGGETSGESGKGCFGSVATSLPFVSILLLAGAVIVKTKKKD